MLKFGVAGVLLIVFLCRCGGNEEVTATISQFFLGLEGGFRLCDAFGILSV